MVPGMSGVFLSNSKTEACSLCYVPASGNLEALGAIETAAHRFNFVLYVYFMHYTIVLEQLYHLQLKSSLLITIWATQIPRRQWACCFTFTALNFSNHFALVIRARKGQIDLFVVSIASFVNRLEIETLRMIFTLYTTPSNSVNPFHIAEQKKSDFRQRSNEITVQNCMVLSTTQESLNKWSEWSSANF